jgi:hypothetical protein
MSFYTNANPNPNYDPEQTGHADEPVQEAQYDTESVVSDMSASSSASATPAKKKKAKKLTNDEIITSVKTFLMDNYVNKK